MNDLSDLVVEGITKEFIYVSLYMPVRATTLPITDSIERSNDNYCFQNKHYFSICCENSGSHKHSYHSSIYVFTSHILDVVHRAFVRLQLGWEVL